jgi:hypothetical protein
MLRFFNPLNVHTLILACLLFPMSVGFLGCDVNEGPAEEAGEDIDEAGEELKDETDDAT